MENSGSVFLLADARGGEALSFRDDPDFILGVMPTPLSLLQLLTLCGLLMLNAVGPILWWFYALMLVVGGALVFRACLRRRSRSRHEDGSRIAVAEISGSNGVAGTVVLCEPRGSVRKAGTFITVYVRGVSAADRGFDFGLCTSTRGAAYKTPLEASYAPASSADNTWLVMLRGFNPCMSLSGAAKHPSAVVGIHWTRRGKRYYVTGELKVRD
jgi:hypothetical protein